LDEVLTKLRPNTTARNFKEFLSRKDNVNRNQYWKGVSRKVDKEDHTFNNSMTMDRGGGAYGLVEQQYMNKRNHESADRNNQTMQSIIQALDMTPGKKSLRK
jgi:hypothetical protein